MKKIISVILVGCSVLVFSQVGIGTASPEKTLDVNGNLRVATITDKSNDSQYNQIMVANASGEIGIVPKEIVKEKIESVFLENKKVVVFSNAPDTDRVMQCGKFELRFNTGPEPQFRLSTAPSSNVIVYFNRIHKENSGANSFYGDNTVTTNIAAEFDVANNWVSLDNSGRIYNTLNEIYITYPGDNNLYRVTLLPRIMRTTPSLQYFYTMMCEKF
ncbi:hypothetical protein [Epilithonimonas sp.]|uniref:hypothetical protein n=1 Tax=Epilithonimonas sp. TaxID=2894511 RepID=UPI002896FA33|nr:hypothetical protein [Epilithonimonas sp.]